MRGSGFAIVISLLVVRGLLLFHTSDAGQLYWYAGASQVGETSKNASSTAGITITSTSSTTVSKMSKVMEAEMENISKTAEKATGFGYNSTRSNSPPTTTTAVPTGLRLVMMGDSLTRYQYLSLVYFLKHHTWIDPNQTNPHFCNEKSFTGWSHFYNYTNSALAPMEYCDCFRADEEGSVYRRDSVENRYFYDNERDNRVIFMNAYGHDMPMHGRWNASQIMSLLASTSPWRQDVAEQGLKQPQMSDFAWQFSDWKQAIETYVGNLLPESNLPRYILFNAGFWKNRFHKPQVMEGFVRALNDRGIRPIWKTTNYNQNHTLGPFMAKASASIFGRWCQTTRPTANSNNNSSTEYYQQPPHDNATWCLNVGWTKDVASSRYFDTLHFVEPIYRVINEELLELMGHVFPPNYVKQPKHVLYEGYVEQ
jgi:hypothetical protein